MLVLAIISTIILAVYILLFFGVSLKEKDYSISGLILQLLLAFVIVTIWVLYAK